MDKFNNIPQELRERDQWLVWKLTPVPGKAKPAKMPHNARTGWKIDPTNKAALSTFDASVAAVRAGKFDGIGYSFQSDDPYCGIDLDATDNEWIVERQNLIFDKLVSYTEISPSGNGAHIIVRGEIPEGVKTDIAELYSKERYLTFTGDVVRNEPIVHVNGALHDLYEELRRYQASKSGERKELIEFESNLSDDDVCKAAEQMTSGRFSTLWETAQSNSEKDMSFFVMLANAGADPLQAKRIFLAAPIGASVTRKGSAKTIEQYLMVQTLPKAFNDQAENKLSREAQRLADIEYCKALVASGRVVLNNIKLKRIEAEKQRFIAAADTRSRKNEEFKEKVLKAIPAQIKHSANYDKSPYSFAPEISDNDNYPKAPGYFNEIHQFFMAKSFRPLDSICAGGALSFIGAMAGRAHHVSGNGLNVFTLGLAPTGTGKKGVSTAMKSLESALNSNIKNFKLVHDAPNSFPAMVKDLKDQPNIIYFIEEYWEHYQKITSKRGSSTDAALRSGWLKAYTSSGADDSLSTGSYSSADKATGIVMNPNVNVFGDSSAEAFYDLLQTASFTNGLIPRLLVIEHSGKKIGYNRESHLVKPDQRLLGVLAYMWNRVQHYDVTGSHCDIEFTPEADAKQWAYFECIDNWFDGQGETVQRQIWSRAHMTAIKVAGLLAVTDACANPQGSYSPVVTLPMLDWAIAVVNHSKRLLEAHDVSGDFGSGDDKAYATAKRTIEKYIHSPVSKLESLPHFKRSLHKDGIINGSFLTANTSRSAFEGASYGSRGMWIKVYMMLEEAGVLSKQVRNDLVTNYDFHGDAWGIDARELGKHTK